MNLTRELIESLIAEKYIDANNFVWDNDKVSFNYIDIKNTEYIENINFLKGNIARQQEVIIELNGRIQEAEKCLHILAKDIFNG